MVSRIKIKGYYRKDGTWVSPHYRKIKHKLLITKVVTKYVEYDDPNQLTINF